MQQLVDEFQVRGFVVLNNAFSKDQISTLNRAVDSYLERFPLTSSEWVKGGSSSYQAGNVLPKTADFDLAIESPIALGLAHAFLGEEVTFEHLSIVIRNSEPNPTEPKGWHRDNTRDYDRRKEIGAISMIYYLTDVSETDHCFSIVPETHNRLVDLRPEQVNPGDEIDITGPAGTTVVFHARCIHSGKVKPSSRQREHFTCITGRLVNRGLPPHLRFLQGCIRSQAPSWRRSCTQSGTLTKFSTRSDERTSCHSLRLH